MLLAGLAGCGQAADVEPTPSPSTVATADPASSTASPQPTDDPVTSTPLDPSTATPSAEALGGVEWAIEDPPLGLTLPDGWREQSMDDFRVQLDSGESGFAIPADVIAHFRAQIDEGTIRASAQGATDAGVQIGITVMVIDDLATLDDGVAWIIDEVDILDEVVSFETDPVALPIDADAVRVHVLSAVAPERGATGSPAQGVHYVIRLDDGRTVIIGAPSVQEDDTFVAMMERIIATIRLR